MDFEMMQGPTIYPSDTQSGPTFGCLFVGGALVEEEFDNCDLKFACDRVYGKDVRDNYLGDYERVKWSRQPSVDFLVVRQPSLVSLRLRWMKDWVEDKRVKTLILFHHPLKVAQTEGIGATTKKLRSLGYDCETRLLKAELCGAATWSTYFMTIATFPGHHNPLQLHLLPPESHLRSLFGGLACNNSLSSQLLCLPYNCNI